MKAFIFEDELYIRCIPGKKLFQSTMVHEVVNRGDIFALRVKDQLLTIVSGKAEVEHCDLDVGNPCHLVDVKVRTPSAAIAALEAVRDKLVKEIVPLQQKIADAANGKSPNGSVDSSFLRALEQRFAATDAWKITAAHTEYRKLLMQLIALEVYRVHYGDSQ